MRVHTGFAVKKQDKLLSKLSDKAQVGYHRVHSMSLDTYTEVTESSRGICMRMRLTISNNSIFS